MIRAHTMLLGLRAIAGLAVLSTCADAQGTASSDALGGGSSGAQGVPRLALHGSPILGAPFGLRVEGAAPGSVAFLAVSATQSVVPLPQYGSAIAHLSWPPFASALLPTAASGSTPLFLEQAALDPGLSGIEIFAQGAVVDIGAQGGLAFTGALAIELGEPAGPAFPGAWLFGPGGGIADEGFSWTALADLDGDGRDDLMGYAASIDWESTVHLGQPDGGFSIDPPLYWGFMSNPVAVDLDGDGNLDALGNRWSGFVGAYELMYLRGQGDGTFSHDGGYNVDAFFRVVGAGDVDGDGLSDVVVWRSGPELWTLSDFASGSPVVPVASPTSLVNSGSCIPVLVDVDGDGNLDAVGCTPLGELAVQLADGSGGFGAASIVAPGVGFPSLQVADVNGDGRDDVTILGTGASAEVQCFIVEGPPGAAMLVPRPVVSFPSIPDFRYGTWFDVDRDGHLDLGLGDLEQTYIAYGDGTGALSTPQPVVRAVGVDRLHFGDVNGDGTTDLVHTGSSGATGYAVQIVGPGNVRVETDDVAVPGNDFTAVAAGDVDRDGTMDVVASREGGGITVVSGNGDGTFVVSQVIPSGVGTRDVQLADMDGDGLLDAVAVEYDTGALSVFRGTLAGDLGPAATQLIGSGAGSVTLIDVDQDGLLDAVVAYHTSARLGLLLGTPSGVFVGPTYITLPAPAALVRTADMDGDGLDDVVATARGALVLHQQPGGGLGAPVSLNGAPFQSVGFIDGPFAPHGLLADVDGDGDTDVVSTYGRIEVNLNPLVGIGGIDSLSHFSTGGFSGVAFADVDGDGVGEMFATHGLSSGWQLTIDAAGDFVLENAVPSRLARPVPTDIDGNGIVDLVGVSERGIELLLNGLVD